MLKDVIFKMMKQWLILVASLLPLSSGEMEDLGRCRDLEGVENSSRCVHQYDDYSAPGFDWSRLKVGETQKKSFTSVKGAVFGNRGGAGLSTGASEIDRL